MSSSIVRSMVAAVLAFSTSEALAQSASPPDALPRNLPSGFDPAVALYALTSATANEDSPSGAFTGLATPLLADPQFGTVTSSIPIALPPGRKLTPQVMLHYSSNGANGVLGRGWDLEVDSIKRDTAQGVPFGPSPSTTYSDAVGFVMTLHGGTVTLDTPLGAKPGCSEAWGSSAQEGYFAACFLRSANLWRITDGKGVQTTFGGNTSRGGIDVTRANSTFAWYVSGRIDPNGNSIRWDYEKHNGHSYLRAIHYSENLTAGFAHIFHVGVQRQSGIRPDPVTSLRGGYVDAIDYRIDSIAVWVDGYSTEASPTKRYRFSYVQDPSNQQSLLASVALLDGAGAPLAPSSTFQYSTSAAAFAPPAPVTGIANDQGQDLWHWASFVNFGVMAAHADMNGDGLPDYLADRDGVVMDLFRNTTNSTNAATFEKVPGAWSPAGSEAFWNRTLVPTRQISEGRSRTVDVDGDGLTDFAVAPNAYPSGQGGNGDDPTKLYVFRNRDGVIDSEPTLMPGWPGILELSGSRNKYSFVAFEDITGDNRPDLIDCGAASACTGNLSCIFHRNAGDHFESAATLLIPRTTGDNTFCSHNPFTDLHGEENTTHQVTRSLFDMNGDGVKDVVVSETDGTWIVYLGNGRGFEAGKTWPAPPFHLEEIVWDGPVYANSMREGSDAYYADHSISSLRDMNGDGLPDAVHAVGVGQPWQVALNTGTGFAASIPWSGTQSFGGYVSHRWTPSTDVDVMDLNGDALADLLFYDGMHDNRAWVSFGTGLPSGLLVRSDNGLGASFQATYTEQKRTAGESALDCPDCTVAPFAIWHVDRITSTSGISGTGHTLTKSYRFAGPHYDRSKRIFRGFRESHEQHVAGLPGGIPGGESPTEVIRTYAPPPFVASGGIEWPDAEWPDGEVPSRPFKLVGESQSALYRSNESFNDWSIVTADDGQTQIRRVRQVTRESGRFANSLTNFSKQTSKDYAFDAYLNVTRETVSGGTRNANGTVTPDFAPIVTIASYNVPTCPTLPVQVDIAESGRLNASSRVYGYDARCNLTAVSARLAAANQAASSGTLVTTLRVDYDSSIDAAAANAGQPTRITDARGNATKLSYSCSQGLYPCTLTNALNQTLARTYDLRWGQALSQQDANQVSTSFQYDRLGRPSAVFRPLDSGTCEGQACASRRIDYVFGSTGVPSAIVMREREPLASSGYRNGVAFYDGFGRKLGSKRLQYVDGVGQTVAVDHVTFDSFGRTWKQFTPFTTATPLDIYAPPNANATGVTLEHDAFGRTTHTTNPDGTIRTVDFVPGKAIYKDENFNECAAPTGKTASCPGTKRTEYADALGRNTRVELEGDGVVSGPLTVTTNTFDALGRVTATTVQGTDNGRSMTTTFAFDSFGRRTKTVDPDSGTWSYVYDYGGNLLFQDDPKTGQAIAFCYDRINRVERKLYLASDVVPSTSQLIGFCNPASTPSLRYSQYVYDSGSYGIGRLRQVVDTLDNSTGSTATTTFSYDARGRIVIESLARSVQVNGANLSRSWVTGMTYDSADRLATESYPTDRDNADQIVSYLYNDAGQGQGVFAVSQTFAGNLLYDVFGRRTSWTDGSGLVHKSTFGSAASNFRLTGLEVNADPIAQSNLQELSFTSYDASGNLVSFADTSGAPAAVRQSWGYGYDGLGRLRSAKKGAGNAAAFAYDGLGNMTSGNNITRAYNPAKPHQASNLAGTWAGAPSYDLNGALTTIPGTSNGNGRTITYDGDGRVSTVTAPGRTVRSLYDFRGERVARIVDEGLPTQAVTYYYGQRFEVTGATLTRHLRFGAQLIAESPITLPSNSLLRIARREREETFQLARRIGDAMSRLLLAPAYAGGINIGGSGGNGGAPAYPVFFVGSDHLGSTVLLTCHLQPSSIGCADRSVYRFYRYDAYGNVTAYLSNGNQVSGWNEPTDRLYTGQIWDQPAGLYYYRARFYDPKLAKFLTHDPRPQHSNPYAYVAWRPTVFIDPNGEEITATDATVAGAVVFGSGMAIGFAMNGSPTLALASVAGTLGAVAESLTPNATPTSITTAFVGAFISALVEARLGQALPGNLWGGIAASAAGGAAGAVLETTSNSLVEEGSFPALGELATKMCTDAALDAAGSTAAHGLASELKQEVLAPLAAILGGEADKLTFHVLVGNGDGSARPSTSSGTTEASHDGSPSSVDSSQLTQFNSDLDERTVQTELTTAVGGMLFGL